MSPNDADEPQSVAVSQLEELGLSSYAARTFVALVGLKEGTAQEVSEVADVPRTRVYDAAEELTERGLVDVQHATPKRFWAVSAETAGRHFEEEFTQRISALQSALDDVEMTPHHERRGGVRTVTDGTAVADRVVEFVDAASDDVVYLTAEERLTDHVRTHLRRASHRGVSVKLAGMSSANGVLDVSDVESFESTRDWSSVPVERLLLVDRARALVSVVAPDSDEDETAIWGKGETNALVVVLSVALGAR